MTIDIRHARPRDQGFITSCLLKAARKGHFHLPQNDREQVRLFKQHVADILTLATSEPNSSYQAFVITAQGKNAGTAILTPLPNGSSGREIYALALLPEYQGKGLGSQVLDWLMNRLQHEVIVARCAPISQTMYHLLSQRGFKELGLTDTGFHVLQRDNLAPDDLPGS